MLNYRLWNANVGLWIMNYGFGISNSKLNI